MSLIQLIYCLHFCIIKRRWWWIEIKKELKNFTSQEQYKILSRLCKLQSILLIYIGKQPLKYFFMYRLAFLGSVVCSCGSGVIFLSVLFALFGFFSVCLFLNNCSAHAKGRHTLNCSFQLPVRSGLPKPRIILENSVRRQKWQLFSRDTKRKLLVDKVVLFFFFASPERINSSLIIICLFWKQYSEKTMIILFLEGMLYCLSGVYCPYITGAYLVAKRNESNFICFCSKKQEKKKKMKWLSINTYTHFKVNFVRKNNSSAPFLRKKLLSFLYL